MKHSFRALTAGILALLMLACLPLSMALAQSGSSGDDSDFIGTVVITKKGFQSARASSSDSTIVFRVHYGERYLCTGIVDGWYEILFPTGDYGYVSASAENTALQRGEISEETLSTVVSTFNIRANKKTDVFSQPKSSAQMRRVSANGTTESTFYYTKGTELLAFGMTTRSNKDWYLLLGNNNGVRELCWVQAGDVTLISGTPGDKVVPGWWYD